MTDCCILQMTKFYKCLEEEESKVDKSDVCMMAGTTLGMAALIMWETFGMMITPTVLTVAAGGCFVAAGMCSAREEELRTRKRKRR